jgi:Ion channel
MNEFNGFYFSFITLSTVGYGDITPVSRIARWLAAMQAMTGLLYLTVPASSHFIQPQSPMIRKHPVLGIQLSLFLRQRVSCGSAQFVLVQF